MPQGVRHKEGLGLEVIEVSRIDMIKYSKRSEVI